MIDFLCRLLGITRSLATPTAMIRVPILSLWEPQWVRVQVLPAGPSGERRFLWPGPCAFEFDEHASFVEEIA